MNLAPLNEPIMTMTEDEIRSLPLVNGKGKKVFNKSSVKKMVFNKIVPSNCYKVDFGSKIIRKFK